METYFAREARRRPFSEAQIELLVGSLLGDATLQKTTAGYAFRVHHAIAQVPLVLWKYEAVKDFVRTAPRISGRAVYFKTITHPALADIRSAFYPNGVKILPLSLLEQFLSPLALAVWIMDDGAADGNAIRLNTQSFCRADVDRCARLLHRRFGVLPAINYDKGMPRLRFSASGSQIIADVVRPHIIPEMLYKLPGRPITPASP